MLLNPDNLLQITKAELKTQLDKIIIWQDKAKETLLDIVWTRLVGNLPSEAWTLWVILFVWPTWVWKTNLAEALAEILLWRADRRTLIPCETLKHGHEIANLNWAPQGYVWHWESVPFLADVNVYKHY